MDFKIDWSSRSKLRGPGETSVGELVRKLCAKLSPHSKGVSISYVDDRGMRKLNKLHRGINKTTDVLSFPASLEKGQFQHLGDIVICLEEADKRAKRIGISRRRQVETLIIHGLLHLCGHDHEKDSGQMMELQASLEKDLLGNEPLPLTKKRGRKPGSKIKTLKSGERVVVIGRAAQAIARREKAEKEKPAPKAKKAKTKKTKNKKIKKTKARKTRAVAKAKHKAKIKNKLAALKTTGVKPKRGPGRPRKAAAVAKAKPAAKPSPRKKKAAPPRSGIIA
ncbi:MAG: rRNA maturation RNase YbeY [Holophagales bacterium]|nr:rRNA maturation RNase YbeY [Holophagales bacterium]